MAVRRTVISASPHAGGLSAGIGKAAVRFFEERFPDDIIQLVSIVELQVEGCIGCQQCRKTYCCFRHDAMDAVLATLQDTDELFIVCPVYFSGPPAQFKAVLDRFQPLFWQWFDTPAAKRPFLRPAHVLVIGEGVGAFGYEPLVQVLRSALAVARFTLTHVEAAIGEDPMLHFRQWLEVV